MLTPPQTHLENRAEQRLIGIIVHPDVLLMNIAGPCEAFYMASREQARQRPGDDDAYRTLLLSPGGGMVRTSAGVEVNTIALEDVDALTFDTLAVAGGMGVRTWMRDAAHVQRVGALGRGAHRIAAFGSGAFILAAAGLLDGRRCAAHWRVSDDLQSAFPKVEVVPGAVFVEDGSCLTAAGASASIDLALKMIEDDLGKLIAVMVAHVMVVPRIRTGEQPQLSAELRAQIAATPRVLAAADWLINNVDSKPSIAALAERFAMSERNFSRVFTREIGMSPQSFLGQVRMERARRWLIGTSLSIETIAIRAGYSGGEHFTHSFKKHMGTTPSEYRGRAKESA